MIAAAPGLFLAATSREVGAVRAGVCDGDGGSAGCGSSRSRKKNAARMLVMGRENDDAARLKLLLADIRDAFAKTGGAEISSADLVNTLIAIEGRPWGAMRRRYRRAKRLTQVKLAHMLRPLAIVSNQLDVVRGYKLWQFEEAFSRYLPPEPGLSSRRVQELAEWYSHQAYWHYSKNALDAGALDADLRAILRKEMSPCNRSRQQPSKQPRR